MHVDMGVALGKVRSSKRCVHSKVRPSHTLAAPCLSDTSSFKQASWKLENMGVVTEPPISYICEKGRECAFALIFFLPQKYCTVTHSAKRSLCACYLSPARTNVAFFEGGQKLAHRLLSTWGCFQFCAGFELY